jgi:DNA polymerase II large subunit
LNTQMSKEYKEYASSLVTQLQELYDIAEKARASGLDPTLSPEIEVANDLAGLVEGLAGPSGVAERIRQLSKEMPREELAFKIAEEIVYGKFGHLHAHDAADQAIRTALAILTEGITAAPLQGVARVSIKDNPDRTRYLAIYFAGPIRSAGGTEQALTLVIGDFVRRLIGLDRYKPTTEEIARFIEEVRLFERTIGRFQYKVSDEELGNALESLPVEVTGIESDKVEVSSYRNLPRIETNRVRGGALRVVNDGIVGRSVKVCTIIDKLGIEGWDWLKRIRLIKEKRTVGFMEEVIAGRPIFSFPSRQGGFRLRYGRARNTGLAAVGIHPATMMVLQQFLAAGTQLKIEGPGKAGVVLPVDYIEPPVVRLRDGSVVRVTLENFKQVEAKIDKILFVGDILISFGDFLYNNKPLPPSGITEELWCEELHMIIKRDFNDNLSEASTKAQIHPSRLEAIFNDPFNSKPNAIEAVKLASSLKVSLHPAFTYLWHNISTDELYKLRQWLFNSEVNIDENGEVNEIVGKIDDTVKKPLEKILIPHTLAENQIRIMNNDALIFAKCLGWNVQNQTTTCSKHISEIIREYSGLIVRKKAPTLLGARMGRPEKAKRREMRPMVNVLFPVGLMGGSHRNLIEAMNKGSIEVELIKRRCPVCRKITSRVKCPKCKVETIIEKFCPKCGRTIKEELCPRCGSPTKSYDKQLIDLKTMVFKACGKLNFSIPTMMKGVKGLSNQTKSAEILEKGFIRAKYDLSVFKDGTIRFDATNAPLTHFKVAEVHASLEKLRKLGYTHDCRGVPLKDAAQICELKVQDVVIPIKCAEYFVRVAHFLDELLEKLYEIAPYYRIKNIDDLIGHLILGLAPHTSVGILGRIIGFTGLNVCYAHPLWHSAKRRDCDGDEDALMLTLDTLINFSKLYLPAQIGGIMDAPLFVIPVVNACEVQRQAHEVDVAFKYPMPFYEKTLESASPYSVKNLIEIVEQRLGTKAQFEGYGYTIPVSDINMGNKDSMYKKLGRMKDKLNSQLALAEKIEAVDARKVASKVLTTHFIRDISGNLRAFSSQTFRCKSCNKKFRRIPLLGKCLDCGGVLTLTVYRGGIEKYLEVANRLIKKYGLPSYYSQRLSMVRNEINSLFEGKKPRQVTLKDFA